jgi:hypothetical protein
VSRPGELIWRKSSHSGGADADCVEIGRSGQAIGLRDSKNTSGPTLSLTPTTLAALVYDVRTR